MDPDADQCYGCGRTRIEIAMWSSWSEEERLKIMDELPARMKALEEALAKTVKQQQKETP